MNQLGTVTPEAVFFKQEMATLNEEFNIATGETLTIGQPVKLNNDGEIVTASAGEANLNVIGTVLVIDKDATKATVRLKARMIVNAYSNAAQNAGPVKFASVHSGKVYTKYATGAVAADVLGWSLTKVAAADTIIKVALI